MLPVKELLLHEGHLPEPANDWDPYNNMGHLGGRAWKGPMQLDRDVDLTEEPASLTLNEEGRAIWMDEDDFEEEPRDSEEEPETIQEQAIDPTV